MKRILALIFALWITFAFPGCSSDAPGSEIQLKNYGFDGVTEIRLQNCHNGEFTVILDENDIAAITAFLSEVVGANPESGKGYYEGTYAIKCIYEDGEEFSLAFGDSDCFYMGKGSDGYPLRYHMTGKTIKDDIVPFFSPFDQSGFQWN